MIPSRYPESNTLLFQVNRALAPHAAVTWRVPIEAEGNDADGMPFAILLHVLDGYLSELEIYRMDGKPFLDYPQPSNLRIEPPVVEHDS